MGVGDEVTAEGLPANPQAIELTIQHRRPWWQTDDGDHRPERWHVSSDVSENAACPAKHRHVGDLSLVIADLHRDHNLLDAVEVGEWALEFMAEIVIDRANGLSPSRVGPATQ